MLAVNVIDSSKYRIERSKQGFFPARGKCLCCSAGPSIFGVYFLTFQSILLHFVSIYWLCQVSLYQCHHHGHGHQAQDQVCDRQLDGLPTRHSDSALREVLFKRNL